MKRAIPLCPLMSAGMETEKLCAQENCAWYITSVKLCSMYIMGKDAILNIREKQPIKQ